MLKFMRLDNIITRVCLIMFFALSRGFLKASGNYNIVWYKALGGLEKGGEKFQAIPKNKQNSGFDM